jgi:hypothetical protein
MLLFGGAMVLIMIWRPRGLVVTRAPSVRLEERVPRPAFARLGRLKGLATSPLAQKGKQ